VGPRAGVDTAVVKSKKSDDFPRRELNPGRPARSFVSVLTELPRLLSADWVRHRDEAVLQH